MLQRYNSCVTLKPVHYNLVSDFNTAPSSLHAYLKLGSHRHNTYRKKSSETAASWTFFFRQIFLVSDLWFTWQKPLAVRPRFHGDHFYLSFTPNPPTTKMTLKPRINRKYKLWRCSVLYKVHFFIITPTEWKKRAELNGETFEFAGTVIEYYAFTRSDN